MEIILRSANEVPETFVERLQTRLPNEQALATTMAIDFGDNLIVKGLIEYGLLDDVLAVDYFGHVSGPSALWFGHRGHKRARSEFERDFPGSYVVLGEPEQDKYYQGRAVNRSHIKALAVGSRVLSLGGVNFTNYSYENCVDSMLDFESPEFVEFLMDFIEEDGDFRNLSVPGERFALTDQSEVLVDYGKAGESLIMGNIFSDLMEDEVRSVTMSSSYVPAGGMLGALRKVARDGDEATVYTNSLTKFHKPQAGMMERKFRRTDMIGMVAGNLFERKNRVHVIDCLPRGMFNHLKAMVIKRPESGIAYIGSHNFHPISVGKGTAEVALRTTDPALISQIETFIEDNLAPSEERSKVWLFGVSDVVAPLVPGMTQ